MLSIYVMLFFFFFFQAEDGIRDIGVTGVQTCALPICPHRAGSRRQHARSIAARGSRGWDRGALPPNRGRGHPDDGGSRLLRGRDPDAGPDRLRRPADVREPARGHGLRLRSDLQKRLLEGEAMSTKAADYSMYVAGTWTESESGVRMEATSPATGEPDRKSVV